MTSRIVRYLLVSLVASSTLDAQSPDTTKLGTMVISASKAAASRSTLTQPVTVISGEELRMKGITRVSDALRLAPGAMLVQNGSIGSVNTLFLRGGESRYTKVLIDGVAVNASGGFFDFSHLTTDNIERIEIVRGPASVVYGADAVSGIVQIFTRQGRGPFNGVTDARAGNYGSRELTLDANGQSGRSRYAVGGGARRTDGALSFNNNYYNGTLSASAGFSSRPGSDALVTARYSAAEFHYPTDFTGAPVDSNAYRVQHRLTVGFDGKSQLSPTSTGRLRLGFNDVADLTEDIFDPFGIPENPPPRRHSSLLSRNKRQSAETGTTVKLPLEATLNVGAEYVRESEESVNEEGPVGGPATPTSSFSAKRRNTAGYAELIRATPGGGSMTLAVRRDDNSDYDAFSTYRAGFNLPVGEVSRIRASINTAFNAPAFNQIRPTLYTTGSPGLRPERSRSWEVGLEQSLFNGSGHVAAGYFDQRFSDLIQYVAGGPPAYLGGYANLTEARSSGYEVEVAMTSANGWSGAAAYTRVRPRVTKLSSSYFGDLREGDALIRRPAHSGNASLTWSRPRRASASLIGSYVGKRPDLDFTQFPSPVVTLPAYTKLDAAASFTLWHSAAGASAFSATMRVDNLLDRRYEDVLNFTAPRRTWLIGARFEGAM